MVSECNLCRYGAPSIIIPKRQVRLRGSSWPKLCQVWDRTEIWSKEILIWSLLEANLCWNMHLVCLHCIKNSCCATVGNWNSVPVLWVGLQQSKWIYLVLNLVQNWRDVSIETALWYLGSGWVSSISPGPSPIFCFLVLERPYARPPSLALECPLPPLSQPPLSPQLLVHVLVVHVT